MRGLARGARVVFALPLFCIVAVFMPARPASAVLPRESHYLMRFKEVSPHFGSVLERMVFKEGFSNVETRETLKRIDEWISQSKYPRLGRFLDALSDEDVMKVFGLFNTGVVIGSTAELPLFEDLMARGQMTVLTLPVRGEFAVKHYHASADADTATGTVNTLRFVLAREGKPLDEIPAAANDPATPTHSIIAPAEGNISFASRTVAQPMQNLQCNPDEYSVVISHGGGEISSISCARDGVKNLGEHKSVVCTDVVGQVCLGELGSAPYIDYSFYKKKTGVNPAQPVFAVYFARGENDDTYHLVVSGTPSAGQYVMDVETYIGGK